MSAKLLGEATVGSIVKLNVDGMPTNFIVVNQGIPQNDTSMYDASCNGTWVLMQDILENRFWDSSKVPFYLAEIKNWLNEDFIKTLDENIQIALPTVKIPYYADESVGRDPYDVNSGANGLPVKVFLLTWAEMNGNPYHEGSGGSDTSHYISTYEGKALSYFSSASSSGQSSLRVANYNGNPERYWQRNPYFGLNYTRPGLTTNVGYTSDGYFGWEAGVRPAMIFPSDWYLLDTGFVTPNSPPTAPGSIEVSGVVIGERATITLTAATDPDGTIASYIYERLVDGGTGWQQIANVNSLTQTDTISAEWGTVQYRACAVDDKGVAGEYVTSETFEVNAGWVVISGPDEAMGDKPGPFDFAFSLNVTGSYGAETILYSAALDGVALSSGSAAPGEAVTLSLDTRLMAAGTHTLSITASAELFVPAYKVYTFSVPETALDTGGRAEQIRNPKWKSIFPVTLGRLVIGPGGVDFNTLFARQADSALQLAAGRYTGTGTSGAEAPTQLVFGFVPQVVLVTPGAAAAPALIWCGQSGGDSLTFGQQGSALSWYASSAAAQLNESGTEYHYLALGRKEDAE